MKTNTRLLIAKYALYFVGMIVLYTVQTTPGFLEIFHVKPNLVVAAAIGIAMHEGEFLGGIYGTAAGVLCDLGAFTLFGFHSMTLLVFCVLTGLAFIYLLRATVLNFTLILFAVLLVQGLLDFLLNYAMWGYPGVSLVLVRNILPGVAYSTAAGPLVYYLYSWIYRHFKQLIQA